MIGISLSELESNCQTHPKMKIKFFCVTHNTPCCNLCKEESHGFECDVQLKENFWKLTDIRGDMNAMIETMKSLVSNMRRELLSDHWNAVEMEKQKQIIYDEIKTNRQKVDTFLDEFENDVKEKLDTAFSAAQQALRDNKSNIEQKLNLIKKRTEIAERIKTLGLSELKMFLIKNKFHADFMENKTQIDCLVRGRKDVSFVVKPMYDLNHQVKQIRISTGFEVRSVDQSHIDRQPSKFDDMELSSSTVEADEGDLKKYIRSERDITPHDIMHTSENIIDEKSDKYELNEHFFIEHRNTNICVTCVGFLSNNKIVLTEDSKARVLVYKTNGFKIGQIKLTEEADEMTVIDETHIAVSLEKAVVFLDVLDMKIRKNHFLGDYITALSCANNKIFACLQNDGVLIMDISGTILRTLPNIEGYLNICTTINELLYSVKEENSSTLECYDINRKKTELFHFKCSGKVNGIACDKHDNVYIAFDNSEVIKFNNSTKTFITVLTVNNGLNNPLNIDCFDNGNRLLTINDGKEVNIFQKS